jgi:hypothetical protein
MIPGMRIVAAGSYCHEVAGEPPPLKALTREATGVSVRRISRFVELALIGAGRCVDGRTLPAETATYFTSGRGDLEVTLGVLVPMCERGQPPTPFAFVNTVGNSACFHVAQIFAVNGRSQFVTSRYGPLESALRLAALDMTRGEVRTALVGSADMCTAPLAAHRSRIGVAEGTAVGEASHWFLLAAGEEPGASLGVVRSVRSFTDDDALRRHLVGLRIDTGSAALARGQNLRSDRFERFREATGIGDELAYRDDLPWYDSQTGHGIHRFLTSGAARTLVHIDGDPSGRATLLVIDAARPGAADPTQPPRDRRNDR